MVQEKNYNLHLFEKQRKMYKSLRYFTSSKVVKETLIPLKSNHKTHARSFVQLAYEEATFPGLAKRKHDLSLTKTTSLVLTGCLIGCLSLSGSLFVAIDQ